MSSLELTNKQKNQLILARNLYAIYDAQGDAQNIVALSGLNLDMDIGEFVAIHGPSGSGKSSLLRILGGLQHPSAGIVIYNGQEITKMNEDELVPFRRRTVGYVFQEGNLIPTRSAFQNLVRTLRFSGVDRNEARRQAVETLKQLGVHHRMNALPKRLSGGERQRVAIGRALITSPKIILADEPTGNLDYANSEAVMGLFEDLHQEHNTSFLVVTHSKHVSRHAHRSLELRDGQFVGEHGTQFDFENLLKTRKIRIQPDGRLNIPIEMMPLIQQYGDLWDIDIEETGSKHRFIIQPANNLESISHTYSQCPVCSSQVTQKEAACGSCGAKLI